MMLSRFLRAVIKNGNLCLIDNKGLSQSFGDGSGVQVTIRIHDRITQWRLLFNPPLSVGEAYMKGTLTLDNGTLYDFLSLVTNNLKYLENYPLYKITGRLSRLFRRIQQHNPIGKAQKNVAHHYDLSEDLYDLFLDEDRQYSCAYFDKET